MVTWLHARADAVILVTLLIATMAGSYWLSTVAVTRATRATVTTAQLCQAINDRGQRQIILWNHILSLAQPPPHETPEERAGRIATTLAFQAYVHHLFAPRDCQHPLSTR